MGLITGTSFKASMRGAILILVIGNWSVAHGFKLNALETNRESTDNLDHHHHKEENNDMKEDNISVQNESQSALSTPNSISNVVLDEKVRTLAEGRAVAFGFKDDIDPIIVESPPPGINFTNCVVDDTNGYCCIDFVGEIRAAVTNPVLECVTKDEKICHTSYVTQYAPMKEQACEENYEKKCNIVTVDINVNETVTRCMKPLQRVCNDGPTKSVHRIKRDTLSTHLKSITDLLDQTLENPRRISAGSARSLIQKQLDNNDLSEQECKIYFETICTNKAHADIFDKGCERIPVRLCAEGCIIREGEQTCRTAINVASRRVPEEQCEIVPQTVCRTITKLVPQLIPKEYCQSNPRELCQLKFTPNPDLPTIQPLIQRYCIAGIVLENTTDVVEEGTNSSTEEVQDQLENNSFDEEIENDVEDTIDNLEGRNIAESINDQTTFNHKDDAKASKKAAESVENFDNKVVDSVHQPRKLDATPSDLNQLQHFQDKEDLKNMKFNNGKKDDSAITTESNKVSTANLNSDETTTEASSEPDIDTHTPSHTHETTTEASSEPDIDTHTPTHTHTHETTTEASSEPDIDISESQSLSEEAPTSVGVSVTQSSSQEASSESGIDVSDSEGPVVPNNEETLSVTMTSVPEIISLKADDMEPTTIESMLTTGSFGMTTISGETSTQLPVTAYKANIKVNDPKAEMINVSTKENEEIEPLSETTLTMEEETTTEYVIIGESGHETETTFASEIEAATQSIINENEAVQETTLTPDDITNTQDNRNRQVETEEEATLAPEIYTTSNENIVSIKQAIEKKYRNIVPIKAGKDASNQVTSGYDKYKNELAKKQQKPKYGLLKPIKPVAVKPKTTTASTLSSVSPSFETTIIDGFTIPKVSTTIKSKSYEDIKPKALVSKGYSPNDINKITDTVKKIVAEKISSELKQNIFAQEEMAPMEGREESSSDESTVALTTDTIVTVDDTIVTIVPSMEAETTAKSVSEVTESVISVDVPVTAVSSTPEAGDESEEEMVTTVPTVSENLRNNNGESNQEVSTLMESKSQNNINKEEAITTEQTETETTQTLSSYTSTEPITTEKILSEPKYPTEIPSTTMNDLGKPLSSESTTTTAHENKPTTQQTTGEENLEEEVTTHMIVQLMEDLYTVASKIPHDAQKNENMMEAALEVSQPKSEEDSPTPPSTTALPITLQSNQDDTLINLEISTLKPEVATTTQPPTTQATTKQSTTTGITINKSLDAENIIDIDSKTPEKSPRSSKSTTTKSTTTKSTTAKLTKTKSTKPQPTTIQPRITQSVTSQSETTQSSETASTKPQLVNTQPTTTQTTASPSTTLQSTTSEISITQSETMRPTTTQSTSSQATTSQSITQTTTSKSSTSQSTKSQSTTTQSTTPQTTTTKSTTSQSTTSKSTTTRSTTLHPMTTQTTALPLTTFSSSTSQSTTIPIITTQSTTAQPTINEATTKENLELTNLINIDSKAPQKSPRRSGARKPKRDKFNIIRPIATYHFKPQQNPNNFQSIPNLLLKHLNRKTQGQLKRTGGLLELLYN